MHSFDEPVYMISVVAKVLEIHPQTLRQYEREGLITPARSDGQIRLYSQRNIDEIKAILELTRDLGVNIAGCDIILSMRRQMQKMQEEIDYLKNKLNNLNKNGSVPLSKQVVPIRAKNIIIIEEDD